jgi:metal-responsive CopG/Arc/MetJ family transcriptional regulator
MARMQRTQIYLDVDLAAALDRLAAEHGTTRAAVIREAARQYLAEQPAPEELSDDPILGIIALGSSEPGRVSEEHDQYLIENFHRIHHP